MSRHDQYSDKQAQEPEEHDNHPPQSVFYRRYQFQRRRHRSFKTPIEIELEKEKLKREQERNSRQ